VRRRLKRGDATGGHEEMPQASAEVIICSRVQYSFVIHSEKGKPLGLVWH
jgi:hypothetical protein